MDNADKAIPEITIDIFGGPHKLSPTFGTFCRYEKVTGKNGLLQSTWLAASATDMATFVWAALGGDKLGKTIDEVADGLSPLHLKKVGEVLKLMFDRAEVPEAAKKDDAA